MKPSELSAALAKDPLFALVPPAELDSLCKTAGEAALATGQCVFRAGDDPDGLYFVTSGKIRIVAPVPDGTELTLGTVDAGGTFGEQALLKDTPRSATARAASNVRLMRIDRDAFRKLLGRIPGLEQRLLDVAGESAMRGFFRRLGRITSLSPKVLEEVARSVVPRTLPAGATLIREGEPPDSLYIVKAGRLEVLKNRDGRDYVLGEVGVGGFVGELGILTSSPRAATVLARTSAEVLELAGDTFLRLVAPDRDSRTRLLEGLAVFSLKQTGAEPTLEADTVHADVPGEPFEGEALPFIEATDAGATGRACLGMVQAFHRIEDTEPLPEILDGAMDERSWWGLAEAMESVGLSARGCQATYLQLCSASLPAVVPFRGKGYVTLYRASVDEVVIGHPARGLRRLGREEFLRGWSGRTLLVSPRTSLDTTAEGVRMFRPLVSPHWWLIGKITLAAVITNAFGMVIPFLTAFIVDRVVVHASLSLLRSMTAGVIVVSVFTVLVQALQKYWSVWMATRLNFSLVDQFYRHALSLPISYFTQNKVGDVTERFQQNEKIQDFLTEDALHLLQDGVLVVMYTATMLVLNFQLGMMVALYIPVYFLMVFSASPRLGEIAEEAFRYSVDAMSALIESITGVHTVKGLSLEGPVQRRWERHFVEYVRTSFAGFQLGLMVSAGSTFITSVATTSIMFFGAFQVVGGKMSVGALLAFYSLMNQLMKPVQKLLTNYGKYQMMLMSLYRVNEVLEQKPEEEEWSRRYLCRMPAIQGHVVFENVTFSYKPGEAPLVIKGINLTIEPGQTVAVVGRSGAGKSTLAHLLLRLQNPTDGRILIDGYDVSSVDGASLRRQVGVILQDSFLFAGTIRENIAPHQPDASLEQVQSAAVLAGAHEFVSRLRLGYDTIIGERGASLSGGQKQRIAIARAIFADPRILIMDEATSALDTESEKAIQENLARLLAGRTTLVIAHRLSTVQSANKIVVLDSGYIAEEGTHDELMAQGGLYYHLASQQIEE
jgi:ATP-binding cassette subfamily B protein